MATTRSVARRRLKAEYAEVQSAYRWDMFLNGVHEFVQAVGTSLASTDLAQLTGVALSTAFAATLASAASLFLIAFPIVCGIICVQFVVRDLINRRNAELNLRKECELAAGKQDAKVEDWLELLASSNSIKKDDFILARYRTVMNGGDIDNATKEINGYLESKKLEDFPGIVRQKMHKDVSEKKFLPVKDLSWERTAIAFFSGSGAMFGACVTIAGAVLATPVGWGALALIGVASVAVGAIMCYADYRQTMRQKQHIERLENRKRELFASNKRLDKSRKMMEDYNLRLLLKNGSTKVVSDDEVKLMDAPVSLVDKSNSVDQEEAPSLLSFK